jgi:hypothetical protein
MWMSMANDVCDADHVAQEPLFAGSEDGPFRGIVIRHILRGLSMNTALRLAPLVTLSLLIGCGLGNDRGSDTLLWDQGRLPVPGESSTPLWDVPEGQRLNWVAYDRDDRNRVYVHFVDEVSANNGTLWVGSLADKSLVPYCGADAQTWLPVTPEAHEAAHKMREDGKLVIFSMNRRILCTMGSGDGDLGTFEETAILPGTLDIWDFKTAITTEDGFFVGLTYFRYEGEATKTFGEAGATAYIDHAQRRIIFSTRLGNEIIVEQLHVDTQVVSALHTLDLTDKGGADIVTYIDDQGLVIGGSTPRAYRFAGEKLIVLPAIVNTPFFDTNGNLVADGNVIVFETEQTLGNDPDAWGSGPILERYYTRSGWTYRWSNLLAGSGKDFTIFLSASNDQLDWDRKVDASLPLSWQMNETKDGYCVLTANVLDGGETHADLYGNPLEYPHDTDGVKPGTLIYRFGGGGVAIMKCGTLDYKVFRTGHGKSQVIQGYQLVGPYPVRDAYPYFVASFAERRATRIGGDLNEMNSPLGGYYTKLWSGWTYADGKAKPLFHLAEQYYPRPRDDADFVVMRKGKLYLAAGYTRP